jgi:hypothetical protein
MFIPVVWIFSFSDLLLEKKYIFRKIKKQQKISSLLFFYYFNSILFAAISVQKYCVG